MKLLPIVGRELRENSRRRGTYWLRVRVAAQAILIGIAAYVVAAVNPALKLGAGLFWGVAGVSMLFCLLAGRRSTADCVSLEKREGTLGLLFLTDLKGYDVVLGKLAATSVTALYALLAVFPVLLVPLLTGGMTRGEGERMLVVLINTFFLSIAIGVFASAVSREFRTAMAANFSLWLALVCAPAGWGLGLALARSRAPDPAFFYSCPIFSFIASSEAFYAGPAFWATAPRDFWLSIIVTNALAWLLVLLACWIVPRTWGDKPARAPSRRWLWRDLGAWISYGSAAGRRAFRKYALDRNAYFWHAARARFKPVHVWLFLVLGGIWWIVCWAKNGHIWLDEITFIGTAVFLNSTFKFWITLEAGHRLGEDRRSGAFELLLATPLTVPDILRGQWLALRRQFLKPLMVVMVVEVFFAVVLRLSHKRDIVYAMVVFTLMLPIDAAALIFVAMWAALRSKNQTQAAVAAVARILILPWAVILIFHMIISVLDYLALIPRRPSTHFDITEWMGVSLAADLIFGGQAWQSLRRDFRRLATQSPRPRDLRLSLIRTAAWLGALAGRIVPPRLRWPALAAFGVVAALGIFQFMRPRQSGFPPPVAARVTQKIVPLRIFPGGQQGIFLVLPDRSLWRWGVTGAEGTSRAAMPERVGTDLDWSKAVANGQHCVGLRADGTIWEWGLSNKTSIMAPQLAIPGTNWIDVGAGYPWSGSIALRADGTIWGWGNYQPTPKSPRFTSLTRIGTATNWTAVTCQNAAYLALRSDGTLWTWGTVFSARTGPFLTRTNVGEPMLLCAETNWISIDDNGQARNRAGELWDTAYALPNPYAAATAVCRWISPNWKADHIESAPFWMNCKIRPDGTLWSTELETGQWYIAASASTPFRRLGNRSDWVALWGAHSTAFGLTADGTVWAWGYDLGHELVLTASTRIRVLEGMLNGEVGRDASSWKPGSLPPPVLEEPQPLIKLVEPLERFR